MYFICIYKEAMLEQEELQREKESEQLVKDTITEIEKREKG
jgi:hypothetical protein